MEHCLFMPVEGGGMGLGVSNRDVDYRGSLLQSFPLHRSLAFRKRSLLGSGSTINSIRDYFGERLALYMAWGRHLNTGLLCLMPASFLCLLVTMAIAESDQWGQILKLWVQGEISGEALPIYSCLVLGWGVVVAKMWARDSEVLLHRWGAHRAQAVERPRPGCLIDVDGGVKDTVGGTLTKSLRAFASTLTTLASVAVTLVTVACFTGLQTQLQLHEVEHFGVGVVNGLAILVLGLTLTLTSTPNP